MPLNRRLPMLSTSVCGCDEFTSRIEENSSQLISWKLVQADSHLGWHFSRLLACASVPSTDDEVSSPSVASAVEASCLLHNTIWEWKGQTHRSRRSCNASLESEFLSLLEIFCGFNFRLVGLLAVFNAQNLWSNLSLYSNWHWKTTSELLQRNEKKKILVFW